MAKLFRLTKFGHQLVQESMQGYDSTYEFCETNRKSIHRQTFTEFCNGEGKKRETAEIYCNVLKIPNWEEDWDKIFELVPDKIADWSVYDDRWVGRKKLVSNLTNKVRENIRLLLLLGITGIGKTALAEKVTDEIQTRFTKILRVNFDSDDSPREFAIVASRWLEELGERLLIEDKQPSAILKRLVYQLRENRILILVDSLETLLTEGTDGWGDFEDEYWTRFFEHFLMMESSQSRLIVTSQDLPTKIESLASRYPNYYHSEILRGLPEDEQIALFAKTGLNVDTDSLDLPILKRFGKIYHGHPLTLQVSSGEILEAFGGNVRAFWANVGEEIEKTEADLAEAESGAKLEGADDNWKLHKLTRNMFRQVYERRLDAVFRRLKSQNEDAYLLICVAAIYRRPVQESGWLLQLERFIKRLRNQVYSKEQQQSVLQDLFDRYLVESTSPNDSDRRFLEMHNLIRSVALEHRKNLFT
jgi:hypothetical protein